MYDLSLPSELTNAVVDFPDLLFLLAIVFAGIVGVAAALVFLEATQHEERKETRLTTDALSKKEPLMIMGTRLRWMLTRVKGKNW